MIRLDYMLQQIARFTELLGESRKKIRANQLASADDELTDLLKQVEDLVAQIKAGDGLDTDRVEQLAADVQSELGLLRLAVGDTNAALEFLSGARERIRPQMLETSVEPRRELFYVSLLVNLGASTAATGDKEGGARHLNEAIGRTEGLLPDQTGFGQLAQLRVGALTNRATLHQQAERFEAAVRDTQRALEVARTLVELDGPLRLGQVAQLEGQLTFRLNASKQTKAAYEAAQRGLEAAQAMVDARAGSFATVFVRAKLTLANVCFGLGKFEEGEDQVFEAVDAIPELTDSVLTALDMYVTLCQLEDDVLSTANLPRDEVEDSYAELLAKLDTRCPDEEIKRLAHARYDLIVNGDAATAETLLANAKKGQGTPTHELLRAVLRRELTLDGS